MTSQVSIQRVHSLPAEIGEALASAAQQERFKPIQWLQDEWDSGANCFAEPGEAFYAAYAEGRLVGVCGLNRDPYDRRATCGRLRRLYVHPAFRRMGVGRRLVGRVVAEAGEHFDAVRLRTLDKHSAEFFEAVGFRRVDGEESVTHMIDTSGSL